jgi:hypothetical protein
LLKNPVFIGVYPNEEKAKGVAKRLIDKNEKDLISVSGRIRAGRWQVMARRIAVCGRFVAN